MTDHGAYVRGFALGEGDEFDYTKRETVSKFLDAAKQMIEADLVCPKCGEENIPGKPPSIAIEADGETAGCRACGRYGRLTDFQRRHLKE